MCDKAKPAIRMDLIDQGFSAVGKLRQAFACSEGKHMVFLWVRIQVMDLFAHDHEHFAGLVFKISFNTLDMDVMIGDEQHVYACFNGLISY